MGVNRATLMNEMLCDAQEFSLISNLESRASRVVTLYVPFYSNPFLVDIVDDYEKGSQKENGVIFG